MKLKYILSNVVLMLLFVSAIYAQDLCETFVADAIERTKEACDSLRRNQVCYGYTNIEAQASLDASDTFTFSNIGDVVDLSELESLRLSVLDTETGTWGISRLLLQMDLPAEETANVQVILFGDVDFSTSQVSPTLTATANGSINVRSGPSTNDAIVGTLSTGQEINLVAANETGDWVQIEMGNAGQSLGWVFASLLAIDGDISVLSRDASENSSLPEDLPVTTFGNIEAFTLRTGSGDSSCETVPASGVLIQTPEGAGRISFTINEVRVDLGSTMYITTAENGDLVFGLLEGRAELRANGVVSGLVAGTQRRVPMIDNQVSGEVSPPELLQERAWTELFLSLLDNSIDYQPLTSLDDVLTPNNLSTGTWQWNWTQDTFIQCGGAESNYVSGSVDISLDGSDIALSQTFEDDLFPTVLRSTGLGMLGNVTFTVVNRGGTSDGEVFNVVYQLRQYSAQAIDENTIVGSVREYYVISEDDYNGFLNSGLPQSFLSEVEASVAEQMACGRFDNTFTITRG